MFDWEWFLLAHVVGLTFDEYAHMPIPSLPSIPCAGTDIVADDGDYFVVDHTVVDVLVKRITVYGTCHSSRTDDEARETFQSFIDVGWRNGYPPNRILTTPATAQGESL